MTPQGAIADLERMRSAYERGRQVMASQRYEIRNAVALGDQVALEIRWSGTLAIPVGGLPAGGEMRAYVAVFLEFREGKIIAQRNYDCVEPW